MQFVFLLVVGISNSLTTQRMPAFYEFDELKTFRCDFTESEGRRTSDEGVTTSARRETFSDLVIDAIDYRQKTARFIGNVGGETVAVIQGQRTISFIETTMSGNVNILSIFKYTGSMATYKAVFSRHSSLTTGALTISQSYGTCKGLV